MHACNMAKLKKGEVFHLVARGVIKRWQHPFLILLYLHSSAVLGRLYNLAGMLGCQAVALPSTEQIVMLLNTCYIVNIIYIMLSYRKTIYMSAIASVKM